MSENNENNQNELKKNEQGGPNKANNIATLAAITALGLSSFVANSAQAQNTRINLNTTRGGSTDVNVFVGANNIIGSDYSNFKKTTLDLGFMTSSNDVGIGVFYSSPSEINLGEVGRSTERRDVGGSMPHVEVTELVSDLYSNRRNLEAVLAITTPINDKSRYTIFISGGAQADELYEVVRKGVMREYDSNGSTNSSPVVESKTKVPVSMSSHPMLGAGAMFEYGRFGAGARYSRTFGKEDNNHYLSLFGSFKILSNRKK